MDLADFLQRYTDDVYHARDAEAARRYIADPCLRHEHGELVTLGLDANLDRIGDFLARFPDARFENRVLVEGADGLVTTCYDIHMGGQVVSGIEVFRVVDGRITETWNSAPAPGAWG